MNVGFLRIIAGEPRLLFKGGTSLSKAYGLIAQFTEDIDITVFREDIPVSGNRLGCHSCMSASCFVSSWTRSWHGYVAAPTKWKRKASRFRSIPMSRGEPCSKHWPGCRRDPRLGFAPSG